MKSSGSLRLVQKTLTLQKSKWCDGFPVLLSSFWLAGRKRSFVFITTVHGGTDFVAFKSYLENTQQLCTIMLGLWRTLRQPLETIFSHPPPAFALFLPDASNEGTFPSLRFLPDNYHQRVVYFPKALAQQQGEILPVSTWLIIPSCLFKCTPAQRYLVIWKAQDCGPDPKLSLESLFFVSRKPRKS